MENVSQELDMFLSLFTHDLLNIQTTVQGYLEMGVGDEALFDSLHNSVRKSFDISDY